MTSARRHYLSVARRQPQLPFVCKVPLVAVVVCACSQLHRCEMRTAFTSVCDSCPSYDATGCARSRTIWRTRCSRSVRDQANPPQASRFAICSAVSSTADPSERGRCHWILALTPCNCTNPKLFTHRVRLFVLDRRIEPIPHQCHSELHVERSARSHIPLNEKSLETANPQRNGCIRK